MAFDFWDGMMESTTSTGNGALVVAGPPQGYRAFADKMAIGDTTIVEVVGISGLAVGRRESLIVQRATSATLSVVSVLESTEPGNAKISWPSGDKVIKCAPPAALFRGILSRHRGAARAAWVRPGDAWLKIVSAAREELYHYDGTDDILLGVVDPQNNRVLHEASDAGTIASASTTNIGGAVGEHVTVSGSATINALGTAPAGARRTVLCTGTPTFANSAAIECLGGVSITPRAANARIGFRSKGGGDWRMESYQEADGSPLATIPIGSGMDYWGPVLPPDFVYGAGQAYSRTGAHAQLYQALTIRQNGTRANGSPTITGLSAIGTAAMRVGMPLCGTGIPPGATIASIVSSTSITMSASATSSGTAEVVVAPHGVGDGVTTFNVPDKRDRASIGRGDMGGTAANRVTPGGSGIDSIRLGAAGGAETHSLTDAENGPHTHRLRGTFAYAGGSTGSAPTESQGLTGSLTASSGLGQPHNNMPPSIACDYIIRYR